MTTVKSSYRKQRETWEKNDKDIVEAIKKFLSKGERVSASKIADEVNLHRQTIYNHLKEHPEYWLKKDKRGEITDAEHQFMREVTASISEKLKTCPHVSKIELDPELSFQDIEQSINDNITVKRWKEKREETWSRMKKIPILAPLLYPQYAKRLKLEQLFRRSAHTEMIKNARFIKDSTKIIGFSTKRLEKLSSWNNELRNLVAKMVKSLIDSPDFSVENFECTLVIAFDPLESYINLLKLEENELIDNIARKKAGYRDLRQHLDGAQRQEIEEALTGIHEIIMPKLEELDAEIYRLTSKKLKTFSEATFEKYKETLPTIIEKRIEERAKQIVVVRELKPGENPFRAVFRGLKLKKSKT